MAAKVIYTMRDIGRVIGVDKRSVRRLLIAGGVTLNRLGNRWVVAASAVEEAMPAFWKSFQELRGTMAEFEGEYPE